MATANAAGAAAATAAAQSVGGAADCGQCHANVQGFDTGSLAMLGADPSIQAQLAAAYANSLPPPCMMGMPPPQPLPDVPFFGVNEQAVAAAAAAAAASTGFNEAAYYNSNHPHSLMPQQLPLSSGCLNFGQPELALQPPAQGTVAISVGHFPQPGVSAPDSELSNQPPPSPELQAPKPDLQQEQQQSILSEVDEDEALAAVAAWASGDAGVGRKGLDWATTSEASQPPALPVASPRREKAADTAAASTSEVGGPKQEPRRRTHRAGANRRRHGGGGAGGGGRG